VGFSAAAAGEPWQWGGGLAVVIELFSQLKWIFKVLLSSYEEPEAQEATDRGGRGWVCSVRLA
jgi:hypothetical protein